MARNRKKKKKKKKKKKNALIQAIADKKVRHPKRDSGRWSVWGKTERIKKPQ
jgi:hypothetical protein